MRTCNRWMKRFALCMACAMAFALTPIAGAPAVSAAGGTANIGSEAGLTAEAGDYVTIPVNISDYSGIAGIGLTVTYDKEVLTPESVEAAELTTDGILEDSIEVADDNSFVIVWAQGKSENITDEGTIFNIKFSVSDYAEGDTTVTFEGVNKNTFDEDFKPVTLNCSPASVNIVQKTYSSPTLHSSSSQKVNDGSDISIPITFEKPSGVQSLKFRVTYDANAFAFDSVEEGIAPQNGISAEASDGAVEISVSDIPESAEAGTLLTLKFKTAEYAGGTFVFNLSSDDVDAVDFRVKVTNTHAGENAVVSGGKPVLTGNKLHVPVQISNNHGVAGFRITMDYDKDILTPVSVEKDSRLKGSFNNSIGDTEGTFDLLWTGTDNITGDGTLFTVLFTVKKAQDTVIGLDYAPGDTCDENLQDVVFTMQDINVPLDGAVLPKDPVDLAKSGAKISGIGTMTYSKSLLKAPAYFSKKVVVKIGKIKLTPGKDYKVSTSAKCNVGKAKITVYGMGDYTGKLVKTIKINPVGTKLSKLKAAKKGFTVKWKKQSKKMASSRITGYQIRYSLKSNMKKSKKVTVKGYKKTSKKVKKLKGKKKYYVQIRTYKTVKGKKYYSKWSKKKAIKTRK